jgi:YHS domain-containing protein
MKNLNTTLAFVALAFGCALSVRAQTQSTSVPAATQASTAKTLVNTNAKGLALQGYDPVAYFTEGKPTKGSPAHATDFAGAIYHFVSAAHRESFLKEPAKYVPAYGGYCGYAAAINRLSPIDPTVFQIIEGKLILQHNQKALGKWNELSDNVKKADQNWPGLVSRNGNVGKTLVNLNDKGVAIEGHDPVSYFTDAKPALGDPKIEATYNGALYHFVSQEHRATFEGDPAKYTPAFGGYCGYAASIGKVRPVRPDIWSIVDGRLILQHSAGAVELWEKDIPGNKSKADLYWPKLVVAKAGKKKPLDGLLGKSVLPELR